MEIYNEQIADLLEPSSTNLLVSRCSFGFVKRLLCDGFVTQLREDTNKGVYVENLTEFQVETVSDIMKLLMKVPCLLQITHFSISAYHIIIFPKRYSFFQKGSTNRKIAATHMNRESSRSHSVLTCVIESRWEKNSTANFRFARLNLVDLAGSER